jgi:hypothetical protein
LNCCPGGVPPFIIRAVFLIFRGVALLDIQDSYIEEIREQIKTALIIELKKAHLWNGYARDAVSFTLNDIERFNQYMRVLNDDSIPVKEKYSAAIFIKNFNNSLKLLARIAGERDFGIFYNYYLLYKNRLNISDVLNLDVSTVAKTKDKVLKKLSIILYPELNILDMLM